MCFVFAGGGSDCFLVYGVAAYSLLYILIQFVGTVFAASGALVSMSSPSFVHSSLLCPYKDLTRRLGA